jgi:hypothetical protein
MYRDEEAKFRICPPQGLIFESGLYLFKQTTLDALNKNKWNTNSGFTTSSDKFVSSASVIIIQPM